jgi:hypothetical protein
MDLAWQKTLSGYCRYPRLPGQVRNVERGAGRTHAAPSGWYILSMWPHSSAGCWRGRARGGRKGKKHLTSQGQQVDRLVFEQRPSDTYGDLSCLSHDLERVDKTKETL